MAQTERTEATEKKFAKNKKQADDKVEERMDDQFASEDSDLNQTSSSEKLKPRRTDANSQG